ncbi:hypothetical protein [Sphingomonas corticis]|uniref:Uncharacterized protein n=1 Tax=Sphingomonas corticis TaxID=2722791 RepID=A0ABX1CMU3_9SPHN|nr:hypothetical protein [Sphingomonas corticis]NJR78759.1 hypothetical protein [Sphingomonas corticis]
MSGGVQPLPNPPRAKPVIMTGSPKSRAAARPRREDFRIRLSPEDHAKVLAHIAAAGFSGPFAKQDWLRSLIPAMAPPRPSRAARGEDTAQRMPMPGGQEALALLGNVAVDLRDAARDLRRLREWIDRIDPVFIADEHRERVKHELPVIAEKVLTRLTALEPALRPRLDSAIDAIVAPKRRAR